jgi:hypothetical protein
MDGLDILIIAMNAALLVLLFALWYFKNKKDLTYLPPQLKSIKLEQITISGTVSKGKDAGGKELWFQIGKDKHKIGGNIFRNTVINYETDVIWMSAFDLLRQIDDIKVYAEQQIYFDSFFVTFTFEGDRRITYQRDDLIVGTLKFQTFKSKLLNELETF